MIHRGFNLRPHLFVASESMAAWLFCLFILHHLCTLQPSRNLADLSFALKSQLSITLRRKKNAFHWHTDSEVHSIFKVEITFKGFWLMSSSVLVLLTLRITRRRVYWIYMSWIYQPTLGLCISTVHTTLPSGHDNPMPSDPWIRSTESRNRILNVTLASIALWSFIQVMVPGWITLMLQKRNWAFME